MCNEKINKHFVNITGYAEFYSLEYIEKQLE